VSSTTDASLAGGPGPVALVGFMGAGKSSVGRALAARLGLAFVDCDEVIAREAGPIPQIFARSGEAGFRSLEREVVRRVLADAGVHPRVVALGGGAVLSSEVREALAGFPLVVWLTAPIDDLWRRVTSGGEAERPLAADLEAFRARYEERAALYEQVAGARVANNAARDLAAVVDEIAALLAPIRGAPVGGRP